MAARTCHNPSMTMRSGRGAISITAVMLVGLGVGGVGCGHGREAPPDADVQTCPNDVPATCPSPVPSYANEVAPIIHERCGGCHTAGGIEASRSFDTYEQVQPQRLGMLGQLHSCLMPPYGYPQPTAAERQAVLGWIKCDAPNN